MVLIHKLEKSFWLSLKTTPPQKTISQFIKETTCEIDNETVLDPQRSILQYRQTKEGEIPQNLPRGWLSRLSPTESRIDFPQACWKKKKNLDEVKIETLESINDQVKTLAINPSNYMLRLANNIFVMRHSKNCRLVCLCNSPLNDLHFNTQCPTLAATIKNSLWITLFVLIKEADETLTNLNKNIKLPPRLLNGITKLD